MHLGSLPDTHTHMCADVFDEETGELVRTSGAQVIGAHPENGLQIVLKTGPFGRYLELEDSEELPEQMAQVGGGKGVCACAHARARGR